MTWAMFQIEEAKEFFSEGDDGMMAGEYELLINLENSKSK